MRWPTRLSLILLAATFALPACQTLPGKKIDKVLYGEQLSGTFTPSGLPDVELPRGLTYQPKKSTVLHSGDHAIGEFLFKGRFQGEALADFLDDHMRRSGWRPVSRIHLDRHLLLFEKRDRVVLATVKEGPFTTHLTLLVVPQGKSAPVVHRAAPSAEPPAEAVDQVPLFPEEQ